MNAIDGAAIPLDIIGGFSIIMTQRVMHSARLLGLNEQWSKLQSLIPRCESCLPTKPKPAAG